MEITSNFFYAYDHVLTKWLKRNGFAPNCTGRHIKTGSQFWQFTQSSELAASIDEWRVVQQNIENNYYAKK